MSEGAHHAQTFGITAAATERPATARFSLLEAGPERADEGGGPTPWRAEAILQFKCLTRG